MVHSHQSLLQWLAPPGHSVTVDSVHVSTLSRTLTHASFREIRQVLYRHLSLALKVLLLST